MIKQLHMDSQIHTILGGRLRLRDYVVWLAVLVSKAASCAILTVPPQ